MDEGWKMLRSVSLTPERLKFGEGKAQAWRGVEYSRSPFLSSHSYKMGVFSDAPIADVSSCLRLPFLVEEDDGIEMRLGPIIPYPPFTRVVGVLEVASEGGGKTNGLRGGRGPGDYGLVLREADWLVAVNAVLAHVSLSEVYDAGNKEEMLDHAEIAVSGLKGLIVKTIVS